MRYELSDYEWTTIKPMLPNKPCGVPVDPLVCATYAVEHLERDLAQLDELERRT